MSLISVVWGVVVREIVVLGVVVRKGGYLKGGCPGVGVLELVSTAPIGLNSISCNLVFSKYKCTYINGQIFRRISK